MFNSSINVRLKTLFDKMYLSRNVFEKMKSLIESLTEGSYSYNLLMVKANEILNLINNISDTISGLDNYVSSINTINTAKTNFDSDYESITLTLINRYIDIINKLLTDIEAARVIVEAGDRNYLNNPGAVVASYNEPQVDPNGKYFIPTDDVYAWNTIEKDKTLFTNPNLAIYADDYKKIDPLNESAAEYSGNVNSKVLSRDSIIVDVLINTNKSGFSLSSINSNTGEEYKYIEDEYESDIVVNTNDSFDDGMRKNDDGVLTTKPKPGLSLNIRESNGYSVSIRRHGELSDTPTKFYASIK